MCDDDNVFTVREEDVLKLSGGGTFLGSSLDQLLLGSFNLVNLQTQERNINFKEGFFKIVA